MKRTFIIGAFLMVGLILASTISSNSSNTQAEAVNVPAYVTDTPSPTETPTPTPVPNDSEGFPITASHVSFFDLSNSPTLYNGKEITLTCMFGTFAKDEKTGDVAALNCFNSNDYSDNNIIQIELDERVDLSFLHLGDIIDIYGYGGGGGTAKKENGDKQIISFFNELKLIDKTSNYRNYQ